VLKASATRAQPRRVQLSVEGLDLVPKQVLGYQGDALELRGPLSGQVPFGSFEVVWLDEDMRVTKTDQGYLAINVRDDGAGDEAEAAEWKSAADMDAAVPAAGQVSPGAATYDSEDL